jgi:hypothetical protein
MTTMTQMRYISAAIVIVCLWLGAAAAAAHAQASAPISTVAKEQQMHHATGTFDVKLTPQISDPPLGRMTIEKQWHGALEGSSKGEMLTAGSGAKGSSGSYVALEHFTGTLNGRRGSFILQHNGTMTRGTPHLVVSVVPDSGTDQLGGLTISQFNLIIQDGKHSYDFEFSLPASK